MTKEISGFSKEECLRLKGILEPLEDIIVRHYGEDWDVLGDNAALEAWERKLTEEEKDLLDLGNAYFQIKNVITKNWEALLHQNDKLDTGEKENGK